MEKQTMTIHRALVDLKMIDAKITKSIGEIEPIGMYQKDKLINGLTKVGEFEKKAKSKLQSIQDLIERKCKIKNTIVEANAITEVEINGEKMTIADAINFKNIIIFKKMLVETLTKKSNSVKALFIRENERISGIALDNAKIMLGKQGDDKIKPVDEDVKNIIEPFLKRNLYHLSDVLEIEVLLEKLNIEIDEFVAEVDSVLSEINSITLIEI